MSLRLDPDVEKRLRAMPGNNVCVDCETKGPQWASVSFGVFMCLECSGQHRALGVHISFVRSVTMDSWSEKQINTMEHGGNEKMNAFLAEHGTPKNTPIHAKYHTYGAKLYKERLAAEIEGRPLPTSISVSEEEGSSVSQSSEPLPGESEADYVARQRKIQEEARERMRKKFGSSSGLKSSGRMQGIGSSANEPSGRSSLLGSDVGLNVDLDAVQKNIADVSQKAYSFMSSSISVLGDQLEKAKLAYLDSPAEVSGDAATASPSAEGESTGAGAGAGAGGSYLGGLVPPSILSFVPPAVNQETVYKSWSSLTSSAASFWEQASTATYDTVQKLGQTLGETDAASAAGNTNNSNSNATKSSWSDDEDFNAALNGSSSNPSSSPRTNNSNNDFNSTSSSSYSSASSTSSKSTSGKQAAPSKDADFFATFGL